MAGIIALVVSTVVLSWFLRRLFPALFAVIFVLVAPIWLIGGLLLDLLAFLRLIGGGFVRKISRVKVFLSK